MVESDDSETLDLLSSPIPFPVRLLRIIVASPGPPTPPRDVVEHVESAVWWPSEAGDTRNPCRRRLDGEIRLCATLAPSTAISTFALVVSPRAPTCCRR